MKKNKNRSKRKREGKGLRRLSFRGLRTQISAYGYEYSFADFLKSMFVVLAGIIAAGYFYQLKAEYIVTCLIVAILTLPVIILSQFRYLYEQQRFADIAAYMEQMIYSFKKRPKILQALISTSEVLDGKISELCKDAAAYIQTGIYKKDMYTESFHKLESAYPCDRLCSLHNFLSEVEVQGGEYQAAINILLDDIKIWIARVYEFQKERKRVKNYITFAIGLALAICFATTNMMPQEFSVTFHPVYQLSTTITIIGMLLLFAFVQSKINGTWLQTGQTESRRVMKDYALFLHGNGKAERKKLLLFMMLMAAAALYAVFIQNVQLLAGTAGAMGVLWFQAKNKTKFAKKRTIREVKKQFPMWLRNLSLHLQRENVQVAIENSIPQCPAILQEPLKDMKKRLNKDAVSIRPYHDFLKELDLPELKSAMQMLYALNGAAKKDTTEQINTLVGRNTKLLEQAERLREEDSLAVTGFMVALPMILSFIKLITDIVLIIVTFLDKMAA